MKRQSELQIKTTDHNALNTCRPITSRNRTIYDMIQHDSISLKVQLNIANRMGAGNKALLCAHTVDRPTRRGRGLRRRRWSAYSRPTGLWLRRVRSSMSTYTTQGLVCGPRCWGIG